MQWIHVRLDQRGGHCQSANRPLPSCSLLWSHLDTARWRPGGASGLQKNGLLGTQRTWPNLWIIQKFTVKDCPGNEKLKQTAVVLLLLEVNVTKLIRSTAVAQRNPFFLKGSLLVVWHTHKLLEVISYTPDTRRLPTNNEHIRAT